MTSFRTNVLRNGEWVSETVDFQTFLRAQAAPGPKRAEQIDPPICGLLTRTVADSQMVKSVLPVRLRSPHHNDVAFIGVSRNFVPTSCDGTDLLPSIGLSKSVNFRATASFETSFSADSHITFATPV